MSGDHTIPPRASNVVRVVSQERGCDLSAPRVAHFQENIDLIDSE
jgi:hypothetical protein